MGWLETCELNDKRGEHHYVFHLVDAHTLDQMVATNLLRTDMRQEPP